MRPATLPFVLTGATGTGKTEVALALAERLGAEIVCADSRQLYRGLDVATGKPTSAERARVPHHGFDTLDPAQTSSAGEYARTTRPILAHLEADATPALLVGGTGLYLRALHAGLAEVPEIPAEVRDRVRAQLAEQGPAALHGELAALDPILAGRLAPLDRQRVSRGLEVVLATGKPLSDWQADAQHDPEPWFWVALGRPRADHADFLARRARAFFDGGLLEEVAALRAAGVQRDAPGLDALGYREALDVLEHTRSIDDAVLVLTRHTVHYAKRQATWLRGEERRISLVFREVGVHESAGQVALELAERYEQALVTLGRRPLAGRAGRLSR